MHHVCELGRDPLGARANKSKQAVPLGSSACWLEKLKTTHKKLLQVPHFFREAFEKGKQKSEALV